MTHPTPPNPADQQTSADAGVREAIARLTRFTKGESGYAVYPGGIFMTDGPSPFYDDLRAILAALSSVTGPLAELAALQSALIPSGETKAAYMGEFRFPFSVNWEGQEIDFTPNVPWTTIKEIMAAIRKYAASTAGQEQEKT